MTSDFHENLYRVRYWSKINVYLISNCFDQPILPAVALESKYPGQNFTHYLIQC